MNEITTEERQQGHAVRHYSTPDGRIVPLRVRAIQPQTMHAILAGFDNEAALITALSRITCSAPSLIKQLTEISHCEIFVTACELSGIDLGQSKEQLLSAKKLIGRIAPQRI